MTSPFIIIDEIESALSAVETKIDTIDGIVDTINSRLTATRATYIDNIHSCTVTNNTASSTGTLSQKLSYIINTGTPVTSLSGKIIKSVQRGVSGEEGEPSGTLSISISSVDPNKCLVILDNSVSKSGQDYHATHSAYLKSLTSNTLTVGTNYLSSGLDYGYLFSWQVIEFY